MTAPATAPTRARVIKVRPSALSEFDLQPVESLEDLIDELGLGSPDAGDNEDEQRHGALAIAWAAGYRDGMAKGLVEGRDAGYAVGEDEGRRAGLETSRVETAKLLSAMSSEFEVLTTRFAALSDSISTQVVDLAVEIASAVLDRELAVAKDPGLDAIRRAVAALPDDRADDLALKVRLNPTDLERLSIPDGELVAGHEVNVVADSGVVSGDCVLDCGATRIVADVESAVARAREVLQVEEQRGAWSGEQISREVKSW